MKSRDPMARDRRNVMSATQEDAEPLPLPLPSVMPTAQAFPGGERYLRFLAQLRHIDRLYRTQRGG